MLRRRAARISSAADAGHGQNPQGGRGGALRKPEYGQHVPCANSSQN